MNYSVDECPHVAGAVDEREASEMKSLSPQPPSLRPHPLFGVRNDRGTGCVRVKRQTQNTEESGAQPLRLVSGSPTAVRSITLRPAVAGAIIE